MSVLTRLAALGALSVLAACASSTSSDTPADVSEVLAAAAAFTPTYEDGVTDPLEAAESEGGLQGFFGAEDGSIIPVTIKIDRDANTLTLTQGDGAPLVLTNLNLDGSSSGWSDEGGTMWIYDYGSTLEYYGYGGDYSYNVLAMLTPEEDLPQSGEVGYTGWFNMDGETREAGGSLALAVDFGTGAVTGGLVGSLYESRKCCEARIIDEELAPEGPSGDSFFGIIEGQASGSLLAGTADLTGTVTGELNMLGGFSDNGTGISGGIAGTIDDETMGGGFNAYSDDHGGPF